MNLKSIFLALLATTLLSCESNELIIIDSDNLLIGNWVAPTYNNDETTFKRGNALPKEASGVSFTKNGEFIERTSGFCGTPPLTFFNIDGTFQLENTLISIATNNGYPTNYAWRIVSITETELVVKRELTEQEIDHRKLMDLFSEIENLSYSETCANATNWTFVAYGAKACGGPQGYIHYSRNIDTTSFLNKVEAYSKAEKEFNIKWSVVSDCTIANPPKSIECRNGYPVLIY